MKYLLDTCILVDLLRGKPEATTFFDGLDLNEIAISTATIQELYAGIRDSEIEAVDALLSLFWQVDLTDTIARKAGLYMRSYFKSHGLDHLDAAIAATAEHHGFKLATLNLKHFPMFPGLERPY